MAWNTKFTEDEKKEVIRLYKKLTLPNLFNHINAQRTEDLIGFTSFRKSLALLNLSKCVMLRWTADETAYLLKNYQKKGNIEMAKKLTKRGRLFTKKSVEKKMQLLNIKRTKAQLQLIVSNHSKKGTYRNANLKRHANTKVAEGATKVQVIRGRVQVSIKVNGNLKAYARVRYEQLHGPIAPGQKIYFKDMDPLNIADENLVAKKGCGLSLEESKVFRKNCKAYLATIKTPEAVQLPPEPPTPKQPVLIAVRINARTIIHVNPGTNIEKLKERYAQRTMIN